MLLLNTQIFCKSSGIGIFFTLLYHIINHTHAMRKQRPPRPYPTAESNPTNCGLTKMNVEQIVVINNAGINVMKKGLRLYTK